MGNQNIKVGDKVRAIFNKCGKHEFVGQVYETNKEHYNGKGSLSIRVLESKDRLVKYALLMMNGNYNVIIPATDVLEVL